MALMAAEQNLALTERYLKAIEAGATGDTLAAFFAPEVTQVEFPNRLASNGASRDLAGLLAAAERGQKVIEGQRYVVRRAIAQGDTVAVEAEWSGKLKVALGALAQGATMRAQIATFITFADGKIIRQHSYDCFEPF
jgi:ketosteroid isomerase-like protein